MKLTGGGGGQGFSALGGAIEAGRIRTFGMLCSAVCHRERRKVDAEQLKLKYTSPEAAEKKNENTGSAP
jgi:hypothetical protein